MTRRSADERREELLEAAIRVMIRDGVAGATTRAVVAEAGLPLGAFHYCFRSKEELLTSVVERIMRRAMAPATALAVEIEGAPVPEIIQATLRAYWAQIAASPDEHQLTYELTQYAMRQPGLTEVARRQYRHYLDVYRQSLEATAQLAGVEWALPLPVLARYGLSVLDGLTLHWLIDRDDAEAHAALDAYAAHLAALTRPLAD
ncbi:TetR/AcrR family transcriptional regulator [Streptacidiphilus sp. MAP5-3]|uniref:TetR/AcrR family transcriptional regulator n=1 Tax=unclassified Streptacidiphilus TaxID=2643834 RepID=UPI00351228F4